MHLRFLLIEVCYIILNLRYAAMAARAAVGPRSMKFVSAQVKSNPNYVVNCSTFIRNDLYNLEFTLIKPLQSGYMSRLQFEMYLREDKRYQTLIATEYDVCKIMTGLAPTSLLSVWYTTVISYMNMKMSCPIPEGQYYARNVTMTSASIPPYLLPGNYRITFYNYFGKRKTKSELFVVSVALAIQIK